MDPHPTITIDHYSSSSATATSTSLHSKLERNEGAHYNRSPQQQQHRSPSSKSSSSQLHGSGSSSHNTTGVISKHHHNEHSSPSKSKSKQSKNKVPVRQRSVSPPTTSTNNSLFAVDPRSARRNRRKSVCAVLIAPPSPTKEENDLEEESSDTIRINSTNTEGGLHSSSKMPDSSNHRRSTMDYGAPVNHSGKHHSGHRKHSTPKHSPSASPRGSKSNLAALGSSLMDKINQANLCMRRKSSPAIAEQLTTVEISSLRGSLALADALSSTSNHPQDLSPPGKHRKSSKQSGYSGGNPVYVETSSGMVELRRKDHSNKGYIHDDCRRLSSPSSLEKGKDVIKIELLRNRAICGELSEWKKIKIYILKIVSKCITNI